MSMTSSMSSDARRVVALNKAVEVSISKGDADGASVIRRAVGFDKFLRGEMDPPENVPTRLTGNAIVEIYPQFASYETTLHSSADVVISNGVVVKDRNGNLDKGTMFIKNLR